MEEREGGGERMCVRGGGGGEVGRGKVGVREGGVRGRWGRERWGRGRWGRGGGVKEGGRGEDGGEREVGIYYAGHVTISYTSHDYLHTLFQCKLTC